MTGFNPTRLSLARRRRGLTRRALAEAATLPERTVVAYENGERVPPAESVETLARALRFPTQFFFRHDVDPVPAETASFRALSRTAAARRDRALAGAELGLELMDWLRGRFTLPRADIPDLRPHRDPEAAAMALRGRWGLGEHPISNMVRLLEAKGVRVLSLAEGSRELDAFSFWKADQPFVFLNTLKSAERSRFDAAHELGHLVLHRHGSPTGREAERQADAFSSAFLMPRGSVLAFAPRFPSIERLILAKHHWKVSVSALAVRMHEVGMISDWNYRTLMMELQNQGYRKKEPEGIPREMSEVFRKIFEELRKEKIRRHDVARALAWPVGELDALVFELVLAAVPGGTRNRPSLRAEERDRLALIS